MQMPLFKDAFIYVQEGCVNCKRVQAALAEAGYAVRKRDVNELIQGKVLDIEALAELQLNGGVLPVVVIDGEINHDYD
jgi:glutaredoxin